MTPGCSRKTKKYDQRGNQQTILTFCSPTSKDAEESSNTSENSLSKTLTSSEESLRLQSRVEFCSDEEKEEEKQEVTAEIHQKRRKRMSIPSDSDKEESSGKSENVQDFRACRIVKGDDGSAKVTKWSLPKYSRRARRQRARERSLECDNQLLITDFYKPIENIERILKENQHLKQLLFERVRGMCEGQPAKISVDSLPYFLKRLVETALNNTSATKMEIHGNRFESSMKQFCVYLFLVGGRMLYETLYTNMKGVIPSITTVTRSIRQSFIDEGVLRFAELREFLESRSLPKEVWISEDATRITGRIEYNSKNNLIVGFVIPQEDGVAKKNYFKAVSARQIQKFFKDEKKANYAYVILAQPPVDGCPSFCLSAFGTDNRFTSETIITRWNQIKYEARRHGIKILGFSSDGDTRLLKAMRISTKLLSADNCNQWDWFNISTVENENYVQDTVHIGTKLKTRLTNPKIALIIGDYVATSLHLKQIIENVSKDKHLMTMGDINSDDKMNFKAVEKIITLQVAQVLGEHVKESKGTIAYLKMMRAVLDSYLNKSLDPSKRLHLIWYAVFFLRIWRNWLKRSSGLSATKNFITLNAYLCIELNAHAMIKLIQKFRNSDVEQNTQFTTWLFSSQPCEQLFRATRSLTSTFSTVVNFSMFEILNRLNKIEAIIKITNDLRNTFNFPRQQSSKLGTAEQLYLDNDYFPNDISIETTCKAALREAIEDSVSLGIPCNEHDKESWEKIMLFEKNIEYTKEDEEHLHINNYDLSSDPITKDALSRLDDFFDPETEIQEQSEEDMTLDNFLDLNLKDHEVKVLNTKSPYVEIKCRDKILTVKKATLCWLFNERTAKLSSDRLMRVKAAES